MKCGKSEASVSVIQPRDITSQIIPSPLFPYAPCRSFFDKVLMFFLLVFNEVLITIVSILLFSRKKFQGNLSSIEIGLISNPGDIVLKRVPFVSIHLAIYNEKRVIDRLLTCFSNKEYTNFEVVIVDDLTDEKVEFLEKWEKG